MEIIQAVKHWEIGTSIQSLEEIHKADVNISIWDRNTKELEDEARSLLASNIMIKASGEMQKIINKITIEIGGKNALCQDVCDLLQWFSKTTESSSFRLFFGVVDNDMCSRFHTDINDLRLITTYVGPGTLWLTEDNIDRSALNNFREELPIAINLEETKQVKTGSVAVMKGALFPGKNTSALVHKSPAIEKKGEKRLLLRIDTNESFNF